jgi:urease accessory protein UreE
MAKPIIDAKYLKDLTFRSVERKRVKENGEERTVYVPQDRELTVDDVLAIRDTGPEIIIVTADGQKYTVSKKATAVVPAT